MIPKVCLCQLWNQEGLTCCMLTLMAMPSPSGSSLRRPTPGGFLRLTDGILHLRVRVQSRMCG